MARGNKIRKSPGFLERRRARQGGDDSARARAYTFDLAALHLQLLVAMAGVDEEVRHVEVEAVLGFIDRASLGADDIKRLEELARSSLAAPPSLDALLGKLSKLARRPTIARLVVDDLARVAAADLREDPRETRMLELVCDTLKVSRVPIQIDEPGRARAVGTAPAPAPQRGPRIVSQHRARVAVRKALEASYRDDADHSR